MNIFKEIKNDITSDWKFFAFIPAIIIITGLLIIGIFFLINGILFKPEQLAHFDFYDYTVSVVYEGDCGATCDYGDIVAYKKYGAFVKTNHEIFRLEGVVPENFTFTEVPPYKILMHGKLSDHEYDYVLDTARELPYPIKK